MNQAYTISHDRIVKFLRENFARAIQDEDEIELTVLVADENASETIVLKSGQDLNISFGRNKMDLPIEVNPKIKGGEPVLRGTRIPVRLLVNLLENTTKEDIQKHYPTITDEHIEFVTKLMSS